MKRALLPFCILHLAFGVSSFAAVSAASSDALSPWPAVRYEPMIKSSPFALATPVAPVAAPGFASNLYLTGLAKIGNRDFATIANRDQQSRFSLFAGEQSADGITLVSVEWSDQVGKSKVTVKKGSEFGTLEFDEATITRPAQVTPQTPHLPQVGQPVQRPVITPQRMPIVAPQGVNQPRVIVPPTAPGNDARRRVRIINSAPQ